MGDTRKNGKTRGLTIVDCHKLRTRRKIAPTPTPYMTCQTNIYSIIQQLLVMAGTVKGHPKVKIDYFGMIKAEDTLMDGVESRKKLL